MRMDDAVLLVGSIPKTCLSGVRQYTVYCGNCIMKPYLKRIVFQNVYHDSSQKLLK